MASNGPDQLVEREQTIHQLSREALPENGVIRLKVTSASMSPMLRVNSSILVRAILPQEIKCGDIIVFNQGKIWNTHRVLKLTAQTCLTKGDAVPQCDPLVAIEDILGIVRVAIDKENQWNFQESPWGLVNQWVGWINLIEGQMAGWLSQAFQGKLSRWVPLWAAPGRLTTRTIIVISKYLSKKRKSGIDHEFK